MNDFLGNPIAIGDKVILITPNYRTFSKGIVKRFTPKFVIVEYANTNIPNRNVEIKQTGDQLVIIKPTEHQFFNTW